MEAPQHYQMLTFQRVPLDVKKIIFGYLDGRSFARFGCIRELRAFVNSSAAQEIWKQIFEREIGCQLRGITDWKATYAFQALIKRNIRCKNFFPIDLPKTPEVLPIVKNNKVYGIPLHGANNNELITYNEFGSISSSMKIPARIIGYTALDGAYFALHTEKELGTKQSIFVFKETEHVLTLNAKKICVKNDLIFFINRAGELEVWNYKIQRHLTQKDKDALGIVRTDVKESWRIEDFFIYDPIEEDNGPCSNISVERMETKGMGCEVAIRDLGKGGGILTVLPPKRYKDLDDPGKIIYVNVGNMAGILSYGMVSLTQPLPKTYWEKAVVGIKRYWPF